MRRKTLIVIASAIFACMFSFFVGCAAEVSTEERSFELEENASVVWLDRYDETDVALKKGDASKLMWSSADEKVVTAEKGRLIAQGKGETFVTVSDGKFDQTITVKVRDSGVKPVIGFAEFDAFLNVETEIPGKVNYNGKIYEPSLDYTVEIADESVAVFSEGKIKGLKIGETSAELSASYKGLTLSETVTVSVKPVLYVAFSEDSLDLYNVDGKLGSAVLEAEVFRLGKKIENAEVVYTVTEGEEFVALESGKISAVKEGKSVVEASYSKDGDKATDALEITVHPNWIAGAFENRSTEAITFEAETGEIGGRTGDILKYRAGADVTGENCWEHHITEKSSGKSVLDLYKEGKKYFAYDLYYTSNQNLMVGCGAYTSWIQAGDYFRKDYLTILSDGEVINRLDKNRWITVVYDLEALWLHDMGLSSYFFFFVNDPATSQYIMNVRYYLDGSFMPDENLAYEDKGDYVQATNDEFDIMVPVSKGYDMATGNPAVAVEEGCAPFYGDSGKTIGGRTGIYEYKTFAKGALTNSLVIASSMNDTYDDSMYALSEFGSFLTFDIYPTENGTFVFRMNYDRLTATVETGKTSLGEFENWLIVIADGKKQNVIESGKWQTVCIAFSDNYDEDAYSAYISFGAVEEDKTVYVDNVRYWKEDGFIPGEYAEENVRPYAKTDKAGISEYVSVEKLRDGTFKGAYRYENKTSGSAEGNAQNWGESGAYFKGVTTPEDGADASFFGSGYRFVRFELYIAENVLSVSLRSTADRNYTNYWVQDVAVGEAFGDKEIYAFNADGTRAKQFDRGVWYSVYLPVRYTSSDVGNIYLCVYTNGGSVEKPAVAYIRYVGFEYAVNTPMLKSDGDFSNFVTLGYETSGSYAGAWKYENKTSGSEAGNKQNFGESGVRFNRVTASDDSGSDAFFRDGYHWIKVDIYVAENVRSLSIRCDGDKNFTDYWQQEIAIGEAFGAHTVYAVDMDGRRASKIDRNVWYSLYIPVEYTSADTGWTTVNVYTNGGSMENPAVMYLKNIEFYETVTLPETEKDSIYPKGNYPDFVSVEKQADGSYKYVNATCGEANGDTQNWGESGIFFYGVTNPAASTAEESVGAFFADGYHWIKVGVYFEDVSSFSIRCSGLAGFTEYWKHAIGIGSEIEDISEIYVLNEEGKRVNLIAEKVWYTLYIPVVYEEGYADWTDVLIYTNGGSEGKPSVMYLKDVEFLKNADIPEYELPASLYVHQDKAAWASVETQADGSVRYVNKSSGTEEGEERNWGECGLFFAELTAEGKFYTDGYQYVKTEIKFAENVKSVTLRFGAQTNSGYWIEAITIDAKLPVGRGIYFYDYNGAKVDTVARNQWYIMYIPVYDPTAMNCLLSNGGSSAAPAVIWLKNVRYVKEMSDKTSYVYAKEGSIEKLTDGEFAGFWKIDGGDKAVFSGVAESNATSGNESMGAFFRDGNEYLAMDVWLKEGTSVSLLLQGEGNVWQADTVTLTAGSEIPANVIVIDADGKRVSLIESGKWYRVYFHLVYNHDYNKAKGWSDCYMTVGGAEAEAYVGNVEYYKDFTAPAFAE